MHTYQNYKILAVDDEELICELLKFNLETEGYEVSTVPSAEEALKEDLSQYALFILDIMMGEMSGIKLAHILKQNPATAHIPIIFCSAKNTEEDIIAGLVLGADDYIAKPFSMKELTARVRAIFNRRSLSQQQSLPKSLIYKGLTLDLEKRTATIDGVATKLTRTESELLTHFMSNRNRLFSRTEIFKAVWPEQVIVSDRTIDVNISRIRKKLGDYARCLVNRSGFGYGFME